MDLLFQESYSTVICSLDNTELSDSFWLYTVLTQKFWKYPTDLKV